ncbi:hypothetical protein BD626DRAFT_544328 [Schizophyllum amplum]|uniref:NAD(P)-binding protein n=1 Tax=Schizophyllum amplum TaxID=97359 RepID=A0A550CY04_9AGAR|nr:hypothetical protein BD626DRAFT_544328 [Auriculariopsis ampla]
MSQTPTVYLVSGANRGIGLGLVTVLAERANTIVFAGARNPAAATKLHDLVEAHPGKVHVVKLVSANRRDNEAAIAEVKRLAGRLDVVIANAAMSECYASGLEVSPEEMLSHYNVNVNGPLRVGSPTPKFVPVGSLGGSISLGATFALNMYPYNTSKTALNWLFRKLHTDYTDMTIFTINPGAVETDMILNASETESWLRGDEVPFATTEQSATDMLAIIDKATREVEGGHFMDVDGESLAWQLL